MIYARSYHLKWGTQQLRGPNYTQFWPSIPFEWTIVDKLDNKVIRFGALKIIRFRNPDFFSEN